MPQLPCPLGVRCKDGPGESVWKSMDLEFDNAQKLVEDHVKFAHQAVATEGGAAPMKAEKLVRPNLKVRDGVVNEEAWEYFCHKWSTYKAQANLTVATKSHLESCLGDEVTLILFGRLGQQGWDNLTEETLLDCVKDIFVKKRNRMVNRLKLHSLVQGPDEPVQQFVAKLKQVARTCKYTIKCTADGCTQAVDYSNEMVLDQLVRGLNDDDIQKKVLSSNEQEFNIQNVEKIIVAEECSKLTQKESKSTLPSEQIAQMSLYKKNKRFNQKQDPKNCTSCGGEGHKSYGDLPVGQKADCKDHDKFCEHCGQSNHLASVCKTPEQFIKKNQSRSEPEVSDKDLNSEHNVLQLMSMTVSTDETRSHKRRYSKEI